VGSAPDQSHHQRRRRAPRAAAGAVGALLAGAAVLVLATGGADSGSYRVRATFDSAANVIAGEDVKVAGVKVGTVEGLSVTRDNKAAVTLRIDDPGFRDFRADATCTIRPQSLIGEKFVDCTPTQPRAAGSAPPPPLRVIAHGRPGAGARMLPLARTSSPVDPDLITDIARRPERERLAIILNELGTGLAGRGDELRQVIRRANPALEQTDRVLAILAGQNRTLTRLARDGEQALHPLARDRRHVAGAIEHIAQSATGAAERRRALRQVLDGLPGLLRELPPTMERLERVAEQGTPALDDLAAAAPGINQATVGLRPLAQQATPWFQSAARLARNERSAVVATRPAVDAVAKVGADAGPTLGDLSKALSSFRDTGGIENFMDLAYNATGALNGYDSAGHYVRSALVVSTCVGMAVQVGGSSCNAHFLDQQDGSGQARAARAPLLDYLLGR